MKDAKLKALIDDYLDCQDQMFSAARQIQSRLGLSDDSVDEKNGWTLSMWLFQAPLYSRGEVERVIQRFTPAHESSAPRRGADGTRQTPKPG